MDYADMLLLLFLFFQLHVVFIALMPPLLTSCVWMHVGCHSLIMSMNFTLGDSPHWVAAAQAHVTVVPYYSDGKDSEEIKLKLQVTHLLMESTLRLSD